MSGDVASAGTYTVELDTGVLQDAFILDTSLLNGVDVLDGTTTFADITEYVTAVSYTRGRKRQYDQFGAGTLSFTLNDTLAGGLLNPYDTTSIYYDSTTNVPGLAPMRKVRVSRESTYLFNGIVESYEYQYNTDRQNFIDVKCVDNFFLLANTFLDAFNPTAETSGQRINTVLALPEVDYQGTTSISAGTVDLGHSAAYDVAAGTNVLAYLQDINNTAEFGRLFIDADGVLTFQDRIGQTLSNPAAVFSDQGTDLKYRTVGIQFDAREVVNRATVTGLNGTTDTDTDAASQALYFVQTKDVTGSLLDTAGQITAAATYLLAPAPEPRLTAVTTNLALLTDPQRDIVAAVDIGDTIEITVNVENYGTITEELSVEGIDGLIVLDGGHTITFYTATTTLVNELLLNDAIYGTIDTTNVLG